MGFCFALILIASSRKLPAEIIASSYVTPFPKNGIYKVLVIGDVMADGLRYGLLREFKKEKKISLDALVKSGRGLTQYDSYDWAGQLRNKFIENKPDIAIVQFGINDLKAIKTGKKWHKFGTAEWKKTYQKKALALLRLLRKNKISVYWVGLPVMRNSKTNERVSLINDQLRQATYQARVKFIDIWSQFANDAGRFTVYGPDIKGQNRRLRSKDGIFFTSKGYDKLSFFISQYLRRDLREARQERNIPLAGSKRDQELLLRAYDKRVDTGHDRGATGKKSTKPKIAKSPTERPFISDPDLPLEGVIKNNPFQKRGDSVVLIVDQSQPNAPSQKINIVRPALPLAVLQATRSQSRKNGSALTGRILTQDWRGLTGFSITSATSHLLASEARRRLPLTQTPYYKLMIRGEVIGTKPGRADNFSRPTVPITLPQP